MINRTILLAVTLFLLPETRPSWDHLPLLYTNKLFKLSIVTIKAEDSSKILSVAFYDVPMYLAPRLCQQSLNLGEHARQNLRVVFNPRPFPSHVPFVPCCPSQ